MSKVVLEVENLSKLYRLGQVGTGTLSHDLNRWWYRVRGKEDPYLKIGESNDRTQKGESDYILALKDISFKIQEGEVIGLIGKNGAGKSTLLKILSKVTGPSSGSIKIKGRIASLLEVGTGFHQELTGRENIYLNGTILGMKKQEVSRKLDEIVDFAGVERYLDTPVKRYSSGMLVRLGFAVAAHLEPEILIVDEVLAVGDAEFQRKAIGKMKDINSGEGRTVLIVSHNMGLIKNLCKKGIVLSKGQVAYEGSALGSVENYLAGNQEVVSNFYSWAENEESPGDHEVRLLEYKLVDRSGQTRQEFGTHEDFFVEVIYKVTVRQPKFRITLHFYTSDGVHVFTTMDNDDPEKKDRPLEPGIYSSKCHIPSQFLNTTTYVCQLDGGIYGIKSIFKQAPNLKFNLVSTGGPTSAFNEKRKGVIAPQLPWTIKTLL